MPTWNFNVTHQNQTTATGSKDLTAPGNGPVVVTNVPCTCGYNHTLTGTQTSSNAMSGSGANSVAPANDPHAKGSPKGDPVPSWDGSPATEPHGKPRPKKS
jgi:hypothetical protein